MTPTSGIRVVVAGGGDGWPWACAGGGAFGFGATGPMNGGATGPMNGAADGDGRVGGTATGAAGEAEARVADGEGSADGDLCLLCDGCGAVVGAADGEGEGLREAELALGDGEGLGLCAFFTGAAVGLAVGDGLGLGAYVGSGDGRFVSGAAAAGAVSTARLAESASRSSTSKRVRAVGSRA